MDVVAKLAERRASFHQQAFVAAGEQMSVLVAQPV
jgi:hypothetical protein